VIIGWRPQARRAGCAGELGTARWARQSFLENARMDFSVESLIIHAGTERTAGAPLSPQLLATSTYVSEGVPDPARAYGRIANPGWAAVEEALGAIEDAGAVTFASGQAASMALMLALAEGRERIVFPVDGYYNTRALAARLRPHGAEPVAVDLLDLASVRRAVSERPSVLWAETPTNPLLRVADLKRLGAVAADGGAPMVVDNTVATGLLQRPLEFGAVASVYSLTKSLSGHSDVLGGAVVSRDVGLLTALRDWRTAGGGIPGPFESWLVLRGLKTLPLRIERQSANAQAAAEFLRGHPRIRAVHYPGTTAATLDLARSQMPDGAGPLLSFELADPDGRPGSAADADAVVAAARLIVPATSFGGVESTWERRARWAGENAPPALIRMSAGIEPTADIIADLEHSLRA
jgi:cystathionine gamma-synthase